jgi:hypothetical protein
VAWSTPLTAVSNATFTAAQFNSSVRDNLLETFPAKATAGGQIAVSTAANAIAVRVPSTSTVVTSEGTASTTYTALTTPGPAVTVTTGTAAIVAISTGMTQSLAGGFCNCSYAISGSTTLAASSNNSVVGYRPQATSTQQQQAVVSMPSLTSGSNTFTMQYNAGSGGGTATFFQRALVVIPL